jgi:serine/threonine protein phosphatase PrpC
MIGISNHYCLNESGGREQNQDSVWPFKNAVSNDDKLFIVCDGVGGSSRGEVASALTCEGFANYFQQNLAKNKIPSCSFIEDARAYIMKKFGEYIDTHQGANNMATTLTLAYLNEKSVLIAWCGDSRVYQIRNGAVIFQTEDHSVVNMLVKAGDITSEEAMAHPRRNEILRAIQYQGSPSKIDCMELTDVRNGDYILLCSDGLLENIGDLELKHLLTGISSDQLLNEFQNLCQGKTRDNYSMYLLKLSGMPSTKPAHQGNKKLLPVIALLTIVVAGLGGWQFLTFKQSNVDSNSNSRILKPVELKQNEVDFTAPRKNSRHSIKPRQVADSTTKQNKKIDPLLNRQDGAHNLAKELNSSFKNKRLQKTKRIPAMPHLKLERNDSTHKLQTSGIKTEKVKNNNSDTSSRQGTKSKTDTSKQDY